MIDPKRAPVVYIAGPITGVKDYWAPFCENRWSLVREGVTRILDPTTLPEGMTTEQYMRICFAMIDVADVVVMLPGWQGSNGATLESVYCRYIGKPVYDSVEALVEAYR